MGQSQDMFPNRKPRIKPHPNESWEEGGKRVARDKLSFLEESLRNEFKGGLRGEFEKQGRCCFRSPSS